MTEKDKQIYEQKIIKINSYSIDKLKNKIIPQSEIDYKYNKGNPNRVKPYHEYLENEDIPQERLINGPEIFKIDPKYTSGKAYAVSNYGRVKLRETFDSDWVMLKQHDCPQKGKGWLLVENTKSIYVYILVAETWLEKPTGEALGLHHITNDGYDNRPENLIYLNSEVHNKLPKNKGNQ